MGGKGGGSVDYTPREPSAQETELLNLILQDAKDKYALGDKNQALLDNFFKTDFTSGGLTSAQSAELDKATGLFQTTRRTAVDEAADLADQKIRARFASQGILDSSIAGDTYANLEKNRTKAYDQIANEASLFRYGTESDLRKSALQEKLSKIGVLQSASNIGSAQNALNYLSGQRTAESNQALQIALANAQNSGGGFWDFLGTVGLGAAGAGIGGLIGGGPGAGIGAGIGLSGASTLR